MREVIDRVMPICFTSMYPTTRYIVDAMEIFEMPVNLSAYQLTSSNYKNHNTQNTDRNNTIWRW